MSRRRSLVHNLLRTRLCCEAVEEREERLSRRCGIQQQRERDRTATETEEQREGRLAH